MSILFITFLFWVSYLTIVLASVIYLAEKFRGKQK